MPKAYIYVRFKIAVLIKVALIVQSWFSRGCFSVGVVDDSSTSFF